MPEILNTLKPLLADIFGTDEDRITPDVSFADLGADHEDMVEISMITEEEFDLVIDDEDLDGILTVADLIGYITEHGTDE